MSNEIKKKKLRNQTREGKSKDWDAFYGEFQNESQRGAVLVGVAQLDELLRQLLSAFLIDDDQSIILLDSENSNAPLGSFSARIDLSYCLGLIGENERKDLHRIRKIRNRFAHDLHGLTFDDQEIVTLCNGLVYSQHPEDKAILNSPSRFLVAIANLSMALDLRSLTTKREQRKTHKGVTFGEYIRAGVEPQKEDKE